MLISAALSCDSAGPHTPKREVELQPAAVEVHPGVIKPCDHDFYQGKKDDIIQKKVMPSTTHVLFLFIVQINLLKEEW